MVNSPIYCVVLVTMYLKLSMSEYIPPGPRYSCPKETDLMFPCICEKATDDGLYVRCENSGLAVLSLGLGNIASLGLPIERLLIKECKISQLFGPLLHRLIVRTLQIQDTPIKNIDQFALAGVNRTLQELHLIDTNLQEFPKDAFKILGNLSILYIDGHLITKFDKDMFSGSEATRKLEKLHIINGLVSDVPIESFQYLKKLRTLDLHGNKIVNLKKNQFKGLREVEVLDLSHNNIMKMDGSHIADLTKLGWCNISYNNIGEISRGMFARNTVLKVLHLNSNKLKKLDTNSFRGMRFLRRLHLQDNMISDVGRGTFGSVTRIGTVDLSRNLIKKVDYQMFYQVKYAENINLAENQITLIEKQAFTDLYLTTVNISHNQLSKIEIGSFENCNNLTVLDLSHNNLTDIPKMAFDGNTYASEFRLSYNGFTDLGQVSIYNMTGLKVLNVSHNNIEVIPKAAFPKLYELHTVDVSHNKLKDIFNAIFQNLFSLRFLNLSHNDMEVLKPSTFGTVPTVLELDLSYNKLRDVSRGSLAKLASCRVLDVSHNQLDRIFQIPISLGELNFSYNNLSDIPGNTWPTMNALLKVNLSNNYLRDNLNSDSFRGLLTLQNLDLSSNSLTKPPWESLSSMSSLQYLYMKDNNLTSLSKSAFGRLPTMFELDLRNNQIKDISKNSFEGLQQLLVLTLRNNGIEYIPNEAFKNLVALRKLDLSQNILEKIDNKTHGLLDDCLSLEMVNLSRNNIGFLTKKMFPNNPYIPYKLYEVDLSHNMIPVLTTDFIPGTRKVKKLNLAHNIINDIRNYVLGNLTALEVLDLTGNDLKDLVSRTSQSSLVLPENITELLLADNDLEIYPVDKILKAKHLKILDLRNNHLTVLEPRIVKKIKEGLRVYFEGNDLHCDCLVRPIKHYLNHLSPSAVINDFYKNLTCKEPFALSGNKIVDINEDRLICNAHTLRDKMAESSTNDATFDFVAEPDLVFRDVQFSKSSIYLQWYVLSSEDVSDFYIFVRNDKNIIFYTNDISYSLRTLTIVIDDAMKSGMRNGKLELCIQAKSSDNLLRKWYTSQCRAFPPDHESWPNRLNLDKRRLIKKSRNYSSSVLRLVSDSILITLCIFLGVCFRKLADFELI